MTLRYRLHRGLQDPDIQLTGGYSLQDPRIYIPQGVTGPWDIDYRGLQDPRIYITGGYRTIGYIAHMGYRPLGFRLQGLQDPRIQITWCQRTLVYKLQWVTGPNDIKLTEDIDQTEGYRIQIYNLQEVTSYMTLEYRYYFKRRMSSFS